MIDRGIEGAELAQARSEIVAWVGSNVLPHEGHLRAWLRRLSLGVEEIDEIVQESYCLIARLDRVDHIRNGRNYLFQTAKSVVLMQLRRDKVVPIDRLSEIESLAVADASAGPERRASARQELKRVRRLIAALPDRCREIFQLRRIEGVPQRQIADRLGLSEAVVEQQATRGLKLILKAIAEEEQAAEVALVAYGRRGRHDARDS